MPSLTIRDLDDSLKLGLGFGMGLGLGLGLGLSLRAARHATLWSTSVTQAEMWLGAAMAKRNAGAFQGCGLVIHTPWSAATTP